MHDLPNLCPSFRVTASPRRPACANLLSWDSSRCPSAVFPLLRPLQGGQGLLSACWSPNQQVTFRPCGFSPLRRLTPLQGWRVYCAPLTGSGVRRFSGCHGLLSCESEDRKHLPRRRGSHPSELSPHQQHQSCHHNQLPSCRSIESKVRSTVPRHCFLRSTLRFSEKKRRPLPGHLRCSLPSITRLPASFVTANSRALLH